MNPVLTMLIEENNRIHGVLKKQEEENTKKDEEIVALHIENKRIQSVLKKKEEEILALQLEDYRIRVVSDKNEATLLRVVEECAQNRRAISALQEEINRVQCTFPPPLPSPLSRLQRAAHFSWEPSSAYKVELSNANCTARGTEGSDRHCAIWSSQTITGGVVTVNLRVVKRRSGCSNPCFGVVGPSCISRGTPTCSIFNLEGFWGFNLCHRYRGYRNGGQVLQEADMYGYDDTPDGTVVRMTVDMNQRSMQFAVNGIDRGVFCTGLPSHLWVAFSACCGEHIVTLE